MAEKFGAGRLALMAGLLVTVVGTQALAQFNDGQTFEGGTINTAFASPAGSVPYWTVDGTCSPAMLFKDGVRGDNGSQCLRNYLPVDTGTRMIRDLNPGPGSSNITEMKINGLDVIWRLYVSADDGTGASGHELYRVLGTLYPVMTLVDINPGAGASTPASLFQHNPGAPGSIYFGADNGTAGRELYRVNTANSLVNSTAMIKDINPSGSSDPSGFALSVLAGTPNVNAVLFAANDGTNGREIWKTDGTAANTVMIKDINATAGASSDPQLLTSVSFAGTDVKVFFTADDGINGRELWRSDQTLLGTVMVKDIVAGAAGSNPTNLVSGNGLLSGTPATMLFFTVDSDGANGQELWRSRGAADGSDTLQVFDPGAAGSPTSLTPVAGLNLVFFVVGNDLWKSDGTTANTVLVKNFVSPPSSLLSVGTGTTAMLYFAADDGSGTGVEIWKVGTSTPILVKDVNPGAGSSFPQNLTAMGGTVYFSADDGTSGRELWRTDNTAGALLIKDINAGPAGSNPAQFTNWDGIMAFTADDGIHGRELWESDGYPSPNKSGFSYKWDLASLIQSKTTGTKAAVAATDSKPLAVYWMIDVPALGGSSGVSEAGHQINTYVEITDGTDRAPLNITPVDCGDGNLPRPRAALTDGTVHKALAFGMVAVLDQNPCDADPRGPSSGGAPFAYVPAVYDGKDWIPMDLAHIPAGVPSDPPAATSLAQGAWAALSAAAVLPAGLVAATTDPWATKRFCTIRMDVFTDYVRVVWASKQTNVLHVATVPRQYKGGFKALYLGNSACVETPYPFYLDTVNLNGGIFSTSAEPFGACCARSGCRDVNAASECSDGTFTAWTGCGDAGYLCCPIPWTDTDADGDADAADFAKLQTCYTGDTTGVAAGCKCLDHNKDNKINTTDVQAFVDCATGPGIVPVTIPPGCGS